MKFVPYVAFFLAGALGLALILWPKPKDPTPPALPAKSIIINVNPQVQFKPILSVSKKMVFYLDINPAIDALLQTQDSVIVTRDSLSVTLK